MTETPDQRPRSLLAVIGYGDLMRSVFRATRCESRQAVFVLLLAAFITLTAIGIFFRGEGMALVMPGAVLP